MAKYYLSRAALGLTFNVLYVCFKIMYNLLIEFSFLTQVTRVELYDGLQEYNKHPGWIPQESIYAWALFQEI